MNDQDQRQRLELMADRVEQVFALQKIKARVWGGSVTARFVQFHVMVSGDTSVAKAVGLQEQLAMGLGVQSVRVYRQNAAIFVEVPRKMAGIVRLEEITPTGMQARKNTAVLGVTGSGKVVLLRLSSPEVTHALVAGMTGSGKTVLIRTIVASLAQHNEPSELKMVLIDPKGRGLSAFANLEHVEDRMACTAEEGVRALKWVVDVMEERDAARRSSPRLVVVIDELADMMMTAPQAVAYLIRLAQRGREAGIHLVAGTQQPSAAILGPLLRANFPVRLVGSVATKTDANIATGVAGSGAEALMGRGDFLLVASGHVHRFQVAMSEYETPKVVDAL